MLIQVYRCVFNIWAYFAKVHQDGGNEIKIHSKVQIHYRMNIISETPLRCTVCKVHLDVLGNIHLDGHELISLGSLVEFPKMSSVRGNPKPVEICKCQETQRK